MSQVAIAAGIIIVLVLRRIWPLVASVLALALATGIGVWGFFSYAEGNGMSFAGIELSQQGFFLILAGWFALECYGLFSSLRRRKQAAIDTP